MPSRSILVVRDHELPLSDIELPLIPTSVDEDGSKESESSFKKIYGIVAPLVKVGEEVIEYNNIISMELDSNNMFPTLTLTYIDKYNRTSFINTIESDNIVQIQIIPKFDGIYKKFNIPFYITDTDINPTTQRITLVCSYFVETLYDSILKSYGKIDTYKFYDTISKELGLGFCTNIDSGVTNDDRYIYIRSNSLFKIMQNEYKYGGKDNIVLDAWVDFYNNINLIDLYDLYYSGKNWIDRPERIKIWATHNMNETSSRVETEPEYVDCILTNNPKLATSELFSTKLKVFNNIGNNKRQGTDIGINVFDVNKNINESLLIQDGTGVNEKIFIKYIYRGEVNGDVCDYDFMTQLNKQKLFIQKLDNNKLEVTTSTPVFSIIRGDKVDFEWYDDTNVLNDIIEESELQTNFKLNTVDENTGYLNDPGTFIINKRISGQYVVSGIKIIFKRQLQSGLPIVNMYEVFTLTRIYEFGENYVNYME